MAYFQIEKNPKMKFFEQKKDRTRLTLNDYEDAASALLDNAEEYYLFIMKATNGDLMNALDILYPFLSNCGLVCELLLKSLLCLEQIDYVIKLRGKEKHSLYRLYELLKPDTQEKIINMFPHRNDKKENFELCLKENAQIFCELRYSNEYIELAGNTCFIPDLMITLYNMIKLKKQNYN